MMQSTFLNGLPRYVPLATSSLFLLQTSQRFFKEPYQEVLYPFIWNRGQPRYEVSKPQRLAGTVADEYTVEILQGIRLFLTLFVTQHVLLSLSEHLCLFHSLLSPWFFQRVLVFLEPSDGPDGTCWLRRSPSCFLLSFLHRLFP